jgi:aerobic carbon-monoxide dehydrogenase medium subunit
MKPVAFELERPRSVDEACELLGQTGRDAKLLAGGQSLVPLLNFRLARPELLVDLNLVGELQYVQAVGGELRVGAMTRQRALERSRLPGAASRLLEEALPLVAHAPIRNRGTLGGSLAHADAAAELCAVSLALEARLVARSATGGDRELGAEEFFVGPFTTALKPEEVLVEIRLPRQPEGVGWAFEEVARRRGDFALVGVAALLSTGTGGEVREARLAYASMGPRPLRAYEAEAALTGQPADEESFREVAEAVVRELEPGSDLHATREYRLHVARALTRRALARALARGAQSSRDARGRS